MYQDSTAIEQQKLPFPIKLNFYATTESELSNVIQEWKEKKFRVNQIRSWVYEKGVVDFNAMDDIPSLLRKKLDSFFTIGTLKLVTEQVRAPYC
jgi:adenine C2-methylase RlmN of 23S rRNA A2503 and tRNA A37